MMMRLITTIGESILASIVKCLESNFVNCVTIPFKLIYHYWKFCLKAYVFDSNAR
jgi:hypothetical protein